MLYEISDAALDSWYSRDYTGFYGRDPDEDDPYGCDEDDEDEEQEE